MTRKKFEKVINVLFHTFPRILEQFSFKLIFSICCFFFQYSLIIKNLIRALIMLVCARHNLAAIKFHGSVSFPGPLNCDAEKKQFVRLINKHSLTTVLHNIAPAFKSSNPAVQKVNWGLEAQWNRKSFTRKSERTFGTTWRAFLLILGDKWKREHNGTARKLILMPPT